MAEPDPEEPGAAADGRRVCCLVSELIEEAGVDRETARALRRQLLQGVMMFCQWQLDRMEKVQAEAEARARPGRRRSRRITVE